MYVKVHKKGNRWFYNNNRLVGEKVPEGPKFDASKLIYGDNIILLTPKNKYKIIYYGYFDENGNFFKFCKKENCQYCFEFERQLYCPKFFGDNPYKKSTSGYYIKSKTT